MKTSREVCWMRGMVRVMSKCSCKQQDRHRTTPPRLSRKASMCRAPSCSYWTRASKLPKSRVKTSCEPLQQRLTWPSAVRRRTRTQLRAPWAWPNESFFSLLTTIMTTTTKANAKSRSTLFQAICRMKMSQPLGHRLAWVALKLTHLTYLLWRRSQGIGHQGTPRQLWFSSSLKGSWSRISLATHVIQPWPQVNRPVQSHSLAWQSPLRPIQLLGNPDYYRIISKPKSSVV